jgi:hypothetical protein
MKQIRGKYVELLCRSSEGPLQISKGLLDSHKDTLDELNTHFKVAKRVGE